MKTRDPERTRTRVREYYDGRPGATFEAAAQALSVSKSTVFVHVRALADEGILERAMCECCGCPMWKHGRAWPRTV